MNTHLELCKYLRDLISKSLEEENKTARILHLRKIERYNFTHEDADYYDIDLQVANWEIYDYSKYLNSVIKYLEKIGCCFEVTYVKHIHSKDCFISAGYDCYGLKNLI